MDVPISIIRVGINNELIFDTDVLKEILTRDDVRGRRIAVVSVCGSLRKGKSFMLNFFLRYLKNQGWTNTGWLECEEDTLTGFKWRGGSEAVTEGVLVWPKVFLVETSSSEKIAVLLMDTQGVFDTSQSSETCTSIFAFSTLLSSVQIFNLMHSIQRNDLEYLQYFIEYGQMAVNQSQRNQWQKIAFLVRDWSSPKSFDYGQKGGREYLDNILEPKGGSSTELTSLKKHIKTCFKNTLCYLMPYPGEDIATGESSHGKLSEISPKFVTHLDSFVPTILSPKNLIPKEINGHAVTCSEFIKYVETLSGIFRRDDLPKPESIFQIMAEKYNSLATERALKTYDEKISTVGRLEEFARFHMEAKTSAVSIFESASKFGDETIIDRLKNNLEKEISKRFLIKATRNATTYYQEFIRNSLDIESPSEIGSVIEKAKFETMYKLREIVSRAEENISQDTESDLTESFKNFGEALKVTLDKQIREINRLRQSQLETNSSLSDPPTIDLPTLFTGISLLKGVVELGYKMYSENKDDILNFLDTDTDSDSE